jgi:hypothetical protein
MVVLEVVSDIVALFKLTMRALYNIIVSYN